MGLATTIFKFAEGYQRGKALSQVTVLLSLKRDDATVAEIMRLISSASSDAELDHIENTLAHASEHALTQRTRERAAKVHGWFCKFRG